MSNKSFIECIEEFESAIPSKKGTCTNEYNTRHHLITPFLEKILGYHSVNDLIMEETADDNGKNAQKIDYVIKKNGSSIILVEAKPLREDINKHWNQLKKYFSATKGSIKFGVLTNGLIYNFYTDLETPNHLDEEPFFTVNIENLTIEERSHLELFTKEKFDVPKIHTFAKKSTLSKQLREALRKELDKPTQPFIQYLVTTNGLITGKKTTNRLEPYMSIAKDAMNQLIDERASTQHEPTIIKEESKSTEVDKRPVEALTKEETRAFYMVQAIAAELPKIKLENIKYKIWSSHLNINYNGMPEKNWVIKIDVKAESYLGIHVRGGTHMQIKKLSDIYQHKDAIKKALEQYL